MIIVSMVTIWSELTKKWLKASFLQRLMKKYEWNILVMFQVQQGIPGINPKIFLPRHGNEVKFSSFSTFQSLDYRISKNIEANLWGLFVITKTTKQMCQVSLKYK